MVKEDLDTSLAKPGLQDGEFLAQVNITYNFHGSCVDSNKERVQEEIDMYLAILPKGTEVKEVIQLPVVSLCLSYVVKFYNPIMSKVKRVVLHYRRIAEPVGDEIKQDSLLTGVKYYDENDQELYK